MKRSKSQGTEKRPDNNFLVKAILDYNLSKNDKEYKKAIDIINSDNCMIFVPSINDQNTDKEWHTLKKDTDIKLTSVFDIEGLKVIGAFTSPETLLKWTQKESEYIAMLGKDFLKFCEDNHVDRIVIDSDQPTMFFMERNREDVEEIEITKKTEIQVGPAKEPLPKNILDKLIKNLSHIDSVEEIYHFAMIRSGEFILVLGIKLSVYSENTRIACTNAINDALLGEKLTKPLEVLYLDREELLRTAQNVANSLIYTKYLPFLNN